MTVFNIIHGISQVLFGFVPSLASTYHKGCSVQKGFGRIIWHVDICVAVVELTCVSTGYDLEFTLFLAIKDRLRVHYTRQSMDEWYSSAFSVHTAAIKHSSKVYDHVYLCLLR